MLQFNKKEFRGRMGAHYYQGVVTCPVGATLIEEPQVLYGEVKMFQGQIMRGWAKAKIGKLEANVFLQIKDIKDGVISYNVCL